MSSPTLPSELGAITKLTPEERDQYYRDFKCELECPDAIAAGLARVKWLKKEYNAYPFRSCLEIGPHDGFITRWLLDREDFQHLEAIELSHDCVAKAINCAKLKRYPEKGHYVCCGWKEYDSLRMTKNLFGAVVCFEVIEHFTSEEAKDLVKFMMDHMDPAGRGFLCTPDIDGPWGTRNPDPHHLVLYSVDSLRVLLQECGAKNINVTTDKDHVNASFTL